MSPSCNGCLFIHRMASIAAVPACQELFMNRLLSRFPVPKHNLYGYSRQQQQKIFKYH